MSLIKRVRSTLSRNTERVSETANAIATSESSYQTPSKEAANGTVDYDQPQSAVSKIITDVNNQIKRGIPILDIKGVAAAIDAFRHSDSIDDRKLLLESGLMFISRLPNGDLKTKIQNRVVELLYHDLSHPPATYLGNQNVWRTADGSNNNVNMPNIGKAGNNYSRSVQQIHPLPPSQLPDEGLLFDSLLKREKYNEHPGGLSAMMFSFAVLVIHTCFRTSHTDWSVNQTSSYVDLAPLYGWSEETQASVRAHDGFGFLHNDCFAEDRLLFLPPAASVCLVLLNRNHNYIATKLLHHNERGAFTRDISKLSKEQLKAQDDELFNVARLVNCAWFGQIVFSDYFSAILGLCRFGSSWYLNPFDEIRKADHTLVERGQGNAVTVEFNLLYRWHATLSEADTKWISSVFDKVFDKHYNELDMKDYLVAMQKLQKNVGADVSTWTFGGLSRGKDGKFNDEDLAKILHEAIANPANAFGARNTPEVLRIVEIMTIKQSRKWGVCSMNEFRKFLGLKPFKTFEEWNSNPAIAKTAERIYGNIENLELHVGLQAEEAKPLVAGAGLCPGYTVSRAILADAIALTRGDRFFTTDFTPYNLTSWGFSDCQRDDSNPGFGSMLGRLLLRTLPNEFSYNSVYTWFPLMTPTSMKKNLEKLDLASRYDFNRPVIESTIVPVSKHSLVTATLKSNSFTTTYTERAKSVGLGDSFFIAASDLNKARVVHEEVVKAIIGSPEALKKHSDEMVKITNELIKERSFNVVGHHTLSVEIIRDVINVMPLHWIARLTGLDLKTRTHTRGSLTEGELSQMFQEIYGYIFFEGDPSKQVQLRALVKEHTAQLMRSMHPAKASSPTGTKRFSTLFGNGKANGQDTSLKGLLQAKGYTEKEVMSTFLSVAVGATAEYSQALVHVVNLYLEPQYAAEKAKIIDLCKSTEIEATNVLEGYVREALRLDPPIPGVHRDCVTDLTVDDVTFKKGARYYLSIANANMDPSVFTNPEKIDPSRLKDKYLIGDSALRCLGEDFIVKPIAQVVKAIFSLPNLHRGPGVSGVLNRSDFTEFETTQYEYMDGKQRLTLWAQSMILQYDGNAIDSSTPVTTK